MFTIFGFPINLSNLYQANQMPFDAFGVIDGWPYVHYVEPFFFRLFVADILAIFVNRIWNWVSLYLLQFINTLAVCLGRTPQDDGFVNRAIKRIYVTGFLISFLFMFKWETAEALVAGTVRTVAAYCPQLLPDSYVNWFGETAFDSQVGDILQGTIGILMAEYVYRFKCHFEEGVFSSTTSKTPRQALRRCFQYLLMGMFTICTTVFSPLEGVDVEKVFGKTIPFGWTAIPVGFCAYGLSVVIVLLWMYFEDLYQTKMYETKRVLGIYMLYACVGVYFSISFVACSLFNVGTYFMTWFVTPVIFVIISLL